MMSGQVDEAERTRSWWRGLWVYAVMVFVGLLGIGYTSAGGPGPDGAGPRLIWVWAGVIPIYFVACVWHGWDHAATREGRVGLVATRHCTGWPSCWPCMWPACRRSAA